MNRTKISIAAIMLMSAISVSAQANPFSFSYGGRLANDKDEAVQGPVELELQFYRQAAGGSPLPVSPIIKRGVALDDGVFQIDISELLAEEVHVVFSATELTWVQVTDRTHSRVYPRQRITAVPYALKVPTDGKTISFDNTGKLRLNIQSSPTANQFLTMDASGALSWGTPSSGSSSSGGGTTTDASLLTSGTLPDARLSANISKFGNPGCSINETIKFNGTAWVCSPISSPTTDASLLSSGTLPDARLSANVIKGLVANSNIASGAVSSDKIAASSVMSTHLADGSVSTSKIMNNAVTFSKLETGGCSAGQVLKFNGTSWACFFEDNNIPDASLSPNKLAPCTAGQILRYDGMNWQCVADASMNSLKMGGQPGTILMGSTDSSLTLRANGTDYLTLSSNMVQLTGSTGLVTAGPVNANSISTPSITAAGSDVVINPTARLKVDGAYFVNIQTITANGSTIPMNSYVVVLDGVSSVTMPGCSSVNKGQVLIIIRKGSGSIINLGILSLGSSDGSSLTAICDGNGNWLKTASI